MGRGRLAQDAVDFATLMHLQSTYNNHLIAEGQLSSQYMDAKSAAQTVNRSLTFFANYGIRPSDWPRLRDIGSGRLALTPTTIAYLDDAFERYDTDFGQCEFETQDAVWLANWIPFRDLDEEQVFYHVHGPQPPDAIENLFMAAARTTASRTESWMKTAEYGAARMADRYNLTRSIDVIMPKVQQKLHQLLPDYEDEWMFLREMFYKLPFPRGSATLGRAWSGHRRKEREDMASGKTDPFASEQFEDFNDPPLWGEDPDELSRRFKIKVEVLHNKPDEWLSAFTVRVSGSAEGVNAFTQWYNSRHPEPTQQTS